MKYRDAQYLCGLKFVYVPPKRTLVTPKTMGMFHTILDTFRSRLM